RRAHRGHRMAAAFDPRLSVRRRQEETQTQDRVSQRRQRANLSHQGTGLVMTRPFRPVGGDPVVEAELAKLSTMPIAVLRLRYRELFRTDSPKAFGPDLLRRSIAQRIQERAYGGL